MNYYERLGIPTDAPTRDVQRAVNAIMQTFDEDELASYTLMGTEERIAFLEEIEGIGQVLLNRSSRAAYDEENGIEKRFVPPSDVPAAQPVAPDSVGGSFQSIPQTDDAFNIDDIETWDGAALAKVRIARGLEASEVADRLKISLTQLRAIEEMNFDKLPATVYAKGFVRSYAKLLRVDVEKVIGDYFP